MANLKRRLKKQRPLGAYGMIKCVCGKITSVENVCHEKVIFQSKLNSEK